MISGANGCVLALADMGVAVPCVTSTTLHSLATQYATVVPRHTRDNIVADITLDTFGNPLSGYPICGESDGLWSSIYLASVAFRYAVEGTESVRAEAWRVFSGLELLNR